MDFWRYSCRDDGIYTRDWVISIRIVSPLFSWRKDRVSSFRCFSVDRVNHFVGEGSIDC